MSGESPETIALRAGAPTPTPGGAPLVEPPALAAVAAFPDLSDLDAAMSEGVGGYRRCHGNPSVHGLEEAMAALEGLGLDTPPLCRVTASGQAALLLALLGVVEAGRRRVVLLRPCYGGTHSLLCGPLARLGLELTVVDLPSPGEVAGQLDAVKGALDGSGAGLRGRGGDRQPLGGASATCPGSSTSAAPPGSPR